MFHNFFCDLAILQESKMKDFNHPIAISIWGCCPILAICR